MERTAGLGRVAVVDRGEAARRVLRALRELARGGHAGVAVAVHAPSERQARFAREADEAVEQRGSLEDALRAAHADSAWLGPASLADRVVFAEACARVGVVHLGPPLELLRPLAAPDGLARLAAQLGVAAAPAKADPSSHLVEVVVARDARGVARALGVGDASVRRGPVVVATPPSAAARWSSSPSRPRRR